eukprot:8290328-Lingulodinium_polyedra.AAC.1
MEAVARITKDFDKFKNDELYMETLNGFNWHLQAWNNQDVAFAEASLKPATDFEEPLSNLKMHTLNLLTFPRWACGA